MKTLIFTLSTIAIAFSAHAASTKKSQRGHQKVVTQKQIFQKQTTPQAASTTTITNASATVKDIDMNSQFDSLGTQKDVVDKANALQTNNSVRVVQKREVDRNWRVELGGSYGIVSGGDSYVDTRNWGANLDLHITPRWSLGLRYIDNKNQLTSEGQRIFDAQAANGNGTVPDINFPLKTYLALVNWYPIYGKISWFESSITQFDFYLIGGGGSVKLYNGSSPVFTGGVGMGIWWTSRITSRIEVRYQNYKDTIYSGPRNVNSMISNIGIGFLL